MKQDQKHSEETKAGVMKHVQTALLIMMTHDVLDLI